jgi:chromosome segregation ATPase
MSGSADGGRSVSGSWIPWVAALLGFGFQVIWFSSQFGSLSARIEDSERRIALIEQNGSPVVQGLRTEVTINGRRISNLEDLYNTKISNALTQEAANNERLNHIKDDVDSLRRWQLMHTRDDGDFDGRLAAIDRELQQYEAQHKELAEQVLSLTRSPRP